MHSTGMHSTYAPPHMSPQPTSRPTYTALASDDDIPTAKDSHSRFNESSSGLGIHMQSLPSSPGIVYSQHVAPKPGLFSPYTTAYSPRPLYARTPDTLYSLSGISRTRTDAMTEQLIAHRATQSAQWKIYWRTPALMVFTFLAGIGLALAQHFWYRFLHHRAVESETLKFRWVLYGRALAYLSKVAFGGCVVLVFRQRIWRTFRERTLTVLSIDQLFGATDDPSIFVNWDNWLNAPVVVGIAVVFWVIPLATIIFSPGALTFGDYPEVTVSEMMVPTLNFTAEGYKDYRHPVAYEGPDGGWKRSVMYYNTTDRRAKEPGWFDYYDQPSAEAVRISTLFAYNLMNHSTNRLGARQANCGKDYDCQYTQSFLGPGYKCDEVASGPADDFKLAEMGAPFNTSILVPRGRKIYNAVVKLGDYKNPQVPNLKPNSGGEVDGPIPADLGIFKSEPILWIGLSQNSTEPVSPDSPFAQNWTHRYDPSILRCVMHEAKYTVNWNFSGSFFHAMTEVDYLEPVIDTTYPRYENGTTNYDADPFPAKNFVSPRSNVPHYKKTAAYHSMGQVFRSFIHGAIEMEPPLPGPSYAVVQSDIMRTRLIDQHGEPKKQFIKTLETFYSDLVLSLYSAPEMLTVSKDKATVRRMRSVSSFVFVAGRLWMCYAPVIAVTLVILIFGLVTIVEDGTTFSTGFSRILVTTRNTTLDDISRGACLGNDPFPRELMQTRLKFGVLGEVDGGFQGDVQHCAFGVASELSKVKRGVPYAGLRMRGKPVEKMRAAEKKEEGK